MQSVEMSKDGNVLIDPTYHPLPNRRLDKQPQAKVCCRLRSNEDDEKKTDTSEDGQGFHCGLSLRSSCNGDQSSGSPTTPRRNRTITSETKMPAIDVGLLIDLAALAVSTATTIAGTTPPSIATKESRGKVSKDLINRVRISDKSFVYATQALIVAYSLAHAQAIIRANGGLFVRSSLSKAPEIAKTAGTSFLQYLSRKAPGIVNAAHPSRAQAWLGDEHVRRMFRLSCLISAVGGVLRVVCFRTLGRFFTFDLAVHDNHKVIQTGPYALVRHPSYTAILLLAAGEIFSKTVYGPGLSATYRPTAWYIASAVSTIVLILVGLRIREEEKMLQAELGKEYKEYMNNVPARLIPYLM